MLNVINLKNISKEDVIKAFTHIVTSMNSHQFEKLKKSMNKMGVLDNVSK